MRKTLNINLGGLAFIIDENDFELLHNYLETLKRRFSNETERDEIMNDIEARIAEMLNQKLAGRKEVVSVEDVQSVMNIMGKPEDIAGEETTTASSSTSSSSSSSTSYSIPGAPVSRKLFRDPDDAKVGGVISGLCHYFGINDPVWVRIAALILIAFTGGSIIIFYLLLLVIVPKADTAAEKLQMKGEPVNISTIEKEIKDAAGKAKESVHQFVKDQNFFERLGHLIISIASVVLKVFAVFVLCVAMVSLIGVLLGYGGFYLWGTSPSMLGAAHLLVEKTSSITIFGIGFLLFCATPFIALVYVALRALIGKSSSVPWLKWSLLGAWVLGLILLMVSAYQIGMGFKTQSTHRQQIALVQPSTGKLLVQLTGSNGQRLNRDDEEDNESYTLNYDEFLINGVNINDMEEIPLGKPILQLMPSENDSFYIQELVTSRGRNKKDAEKNSEIISYTFSQADSLLNLSPRIYLPKTGKWRGQHMTLRIAIPEGKKVSFADNVDYWEAIVKGDSNYDDTQFANTTWTTEGGKIKCVTGENHKNWHEEKPSKSAKVDKKAKTKDGEDDDRDKDDDKSDKDF